MPSEGWTSALMLIVVAMTASLPALIIVLVVGAIFAGWIFTSIISFLQSWLGPILGVVLGGFGLIALADRGEAKIGVVVFAIALVFGFVLTGNIAHWLAGGGSSGGYVIMGLFA